MMRNTITIVASLLAAVWSTPTFASDIELKKGQTVYVPAYSHVFVGDRALPFNLAITLAIRNSDPKHGITVVSADYFNSNGKLVRGFLTDTIKLSPLASTTMFIQEKDTSGGAGAGFIVKWKSEKEVNAPVIEAIMIGARSGQGISFVSPGREIRETSE